jgi:hypothetical protein
MIRFLATTFGLYPLYPRLVVVNTTLAHKVLIVPPFTIRNRQYNDQKKKKDKQWIIKHNTEK